MKYFFFLILILFVSCSEETTPVEITPCKCNAEDKICLDAEVCIDAEKPMCYNTVCYSKNDAVLGTKKLSLIDNPVQSILSGGTPIELRVKVLREATNVSDDELVGPVPNESVTFKTTHHAEVFLLETLEDTKQTKELTVKTDVDGVAKIYFTGNITDPSPQVVPLLASVNYCPEETEGECVKQFNITISPVQTTLYLLKPNNGGKTTDEVNISVPPFEDQAKRRLTIGAIVETNNNEPYRNQDVTFTLNKDNASMSLITDEDNKLKTISTKTDALGIAQVYLFLPELQGEEPESFEVQVNLKGTQGRLFRITVSE